jgi:hypothetical protein
MGRVAEALACDASNVTGLIDRLESGLGLPSPVCRRPPRESSGIDAAGPACDRLSWGVLPSPPAADRLSVEEQRVLVKMLKRLLE